MCNKCVLDITYSLHIILVSCFLCYCFILLSSSSFCCAAPGILLPQVVLTPDHSFYLISSCSHSYCIYCAATLQPQSWHGLRSLKTQHIKLNLIGPSPLRRMGILLYGL